MNDVKMTEKRPRTSPKKPVSLVARIGEAKEVSVTGDFTQWSMEGIPFEKGRNGEWVASLKLPPGEHQYRLIVDGQWRDHAEATMRVPNPYGSENCILIVC